MIQRVQTIWLFLAAITGFLVTEVPLFTGSIVGQVIKKYSATENLLLFAVATLAALLGFIAIFLFKNRKLQMRITLLGMLLSIGLIALEVWALGNFEKTDIALKGKYYWGSLLPVAMVIFFILAAVGISKDNKLVKSLDRLR